MSSAARRGAAALVILVVVAACGGDAESVDATTSTVTDAATTVAPDSGDDAGSGGAGGPNETCLNAVQAMAAAAGAYASGFAGAMGGTLDDEELQAVAGQLQAMADAAPSEIKDDLAVIADELEAFYTALADADYQPGQVPSQDQLAELAQLAEAIDQDAWDDATANIEAWFDNNCE